MPQSNVNSQTLRRIGEDIAEKLIEDELIPESSRQDCVTSLVRQWITYDGNATLFFQDGQLYLVLRKTLLGQIHVSLETVPPDALQRMLEDWDFSLDDLPEIIDELNRCQSAEWTNADGIPVRLWVNPRERSKGVEALASLPPVKRDCRKMVSNALDPHLGPGLEGKEIEALYDSVIKQWQQHEGNACLFMDEQRQLVLTLTEKDNGHCTVTATICAVAMAPLLASLGFPSDMLTEVLSRINLGQEIEFRDREGTPSVLWYDPRQRRILVRPHPCQNPPAG